MATTVKSGQGMLRACWRLSSHLQTQPARRTVPHITRYQREKSTAVPKSYVPETSLSRPPWPELPPYDKETEEQKHRGTLTSFLSF
ncbi:hypothetical protein PGIGA_G00031150 [Pangasianodon gigas]|uniref:Uncharacterized protein n=1 Tax=Pangasianodon gigas TaxID=30993 RepID=A0ACC5WXQ7_PANGG|nr:hypothetical protein [Pangasianodon gigas]